MWKYLGGGLALALLTIFLGYLAIYIAELPLTIIIVGVMVMAYIDMYQTVRDDVASGNKRAQDNDK